MELREYIYTIVYPYEWTTFNLSPLSSINERYICTYVYKHAFLKTFHLTLVSPWMLIRNFAVINYVAG